MDVANGLTIPDDELHFSFARSGGPGGQNVNKVSSKAILHWDLSANATLPPEVRERLARHHKNRLTTEGQLVIQSQKFRDQAKNVEECQSKLRQMVLQVLHPPKPRKPTRPSRGSKQRRLEAKRQQSQRKASRRKPSAED